MKKHLYKVLAGVIIFCLGYSVCKYTAPAQVITVEKEKQVEKRDVVTRTVRVKNPDGSSTTTRTTEDKTVINTEKDKKEVVKNEKPQLNVSALLGYDVRKKEEVYGLSVQKRFAGPVFLGAWGTTQGTVGLSVGLEF